MADENIANGIQSDTAPTNALTVEQPKAGELISSPDQLSTLKETDIARTTGDAIYRRDLAKEQAAISEYSQLNGAPKTDAEWRAFHEKVYGTEITPEDQTALEEEAVASEEIAEDEGKVMTDEEIEANKQKQIAEGVAEGEEEYVEEDILPTVEEQLISIQDDMDTEMQSYLDQFNIYTESIAADNLAAIQNIKDTFDRRREQTKAINNAILGSKKLMGARSGRQRYAGEIQSTILSSEEQAGISRLADLDVQEQTLVSQAQQAQTEKQWAAYNQLFNRIQENQEQKRQTLLDLHSIAMAQEQLSLNKLKQVQDQKMAELNYNLNADRVGMEYSRLDREQANQEITQLAESGFVPGQFTEEEKASYEQRLGLPEGTFEGFMGQLSSANIEKQLGDEIAFNTDLMGLLDKVPSDSLINIGGSMYQGTKQDDMYVVRETDAYGNVTVMGINEQTGEVKYAESLGRIGKGFAGGGGTGTGSGGGSGIPGLPEGIPQDELSSYAMMAIEMESSLGGYDSDKGSKWYNEFVNKLAAREDSISSDPDIIDTLLRQRMYAIKGAPTVQDKANDILGNTGDGTDASTATDIGGKAGNIAKKAPDYLKDLATEVGQNITNFIGGFLGKDGDMVTEEDAEEIKKRFPTKEDLLSNLPATGPISYTLKLKGLYDKYLK